MPVSRVLVLVICLFAFSLPVTAADLGPSITTTDGKSYTRAADGHYYPSGYVTAAGDASSATVARPVGVRPAAPAAGVVPISYTLPAAPSSCPNGRCPVESYGPNRRFTFPVK